MRKLNAWLIGGIIGIAAMMFPIVVLCNEDKPENSFDDIEIVEHITDEVTCTPTPTQEAIITQTLSLEDVAQPTIIPIEESIWVEKSEEVRIPTCTPTSTPTPIPTEVPILAEAASEQLIEPTPAPEYGTYSPSYFKKMGVVYWGDWRWTWYCDHVLPGGGLNIPGRHYDENNYICDEDDYIVIASDVLPYGTVIDTPFGKQGKVYDCGVGNDYTVDVYCHF